MVEAVTIKKRDIAVDFVKVIATLLVLNSHMGICYGSHSALATGGGIGDALFFFISGFTLFMGRKMDFVNWYKHRIGRIYPTVLALGLVVCLVFGRECGFMEMMTAEKYWFLQCILVCYLVLYPVIRYDWKLSICISISIAVVLLAFFAVYDFEGQMFYGVDNYFRWIFYFSIMLIGGSIYLHSDKIHYSWWHIPIVLVCIVAWYGVNGVSNGGGFAILSMIPLVCICYLVYAIGKAPWMERLFERKLSGNILFIIGNLCLESYLIQKYIFTDALNYLFPLNIPLIMSAVLGSTYLLHILSEVIKQIFDSKSFDWKELLLYKK